MLKINIMLEKAPEYSKWEFLTEGLLSWSFSSSSSSGPELSSHGMCTGFLCQVTKFVKPSLLHVSCWLATLRVPYTDVLSCEAVSGQVGVWFRIRMVHSEAIAKHETQKGKKTAVGTLSNRERGLSSRVRHFEIGPRSYSKKRAILLKKIYPYARSETIIRYHSNRINRDLVLFNFTVTKY